MQTLLIATRNAHKTREIGQMLGSGWRVSDLLSFPHSPAMEETGATFEENAMLKALGISRVFTGLVLADDSGLEVDALGGAPGVRSARFAGGNANDAENRRALIELLKNLRGGELKARCDGSCDSGRVAGLFRRNGRRQSDSGRARFRRIRIRLDVYS
jgi:XTP/dITP diphosphohydrolase